MELRKTELNHIENYIEGLGINEFDLRLELKDHIASMVEYRMDDEEERNLDLTYVQYEITNLVREIKEEIQKRSIRSLCQIFRKNIFSPNIFIILFFATICDTVQSSYWFDHGSRLMLCYFLITPIALFFHYKFISSKIQGSSLKLRSMIKNSWMPLVIIAGIGMVVHLGSITIYDHFFGGYAAQIIGTIFSSLCFGMYVKILFDTFFTIPEMIKEEINLIEFTRNFKIS